MNFEWAPRQRCRPPARALVIGAPLAVMMAIGCASPGAHAQDAFGRLFHSPAQRALLDDARKRPLKPEPVVEVKAEAPAGPQSLSVDGIVRRNDGRTTVWVNRVPTAAPSVPGDRVGPVRVDAVRDAAEGADLRMPDSGRRVRIKVGQEIDVASGTVKERYRLPRPAPEAPGVPGAGGDTAQSEPQGAAPGTAAPAGSADTVRTPPRDAAIERVLRELGRRLDEPARELTRDPTRDPARDTTSDPARSSPQTRSGSDRPVRE